MSTEWLEYLNPTTTVLHGVNSTVINAYMSQQADKPSEWFVALTTNYMIEYGFSTVGLDLPWQGKVPAATAAAPISEKIF